MCAALSPEELYAHARIVERVSRELGVFGKIVWWVLPECAFTDYMRDIRNRGAWLESTKQLHVALTTVFVTVLLEHGVPIQPYKQEIEPCATPSNATQS